MSDQDHRALLKVVVDTREQAPFAFSGLPVEVELGALEAGDYSVRGFERRLAVERKELGDLVGCLGTDRERFERELARLRGYDCAAVVVEAPVHALRSGQYPGRLDAGAAWQSVLAFSMRFRVPFFFCADRADAEAVTFDLLRHYARDRWRELQALVPAVRGAVSNNSGQQAREDDHARSATSAT
jgi:ERCC4-type nuclease